MEFPIVISFYTKKSLYENEVKNLINSCERFNLEYSIDGIDSFGSWELNCAYKPFFILEKIKSLKKSVLWVDADGAFLQAPTWQEVFSADIATRINGDCEEGHPSKVITSTVYVNNTQAGQDILRSWALECRRQLSDPLRTEVFWDQIALRNVLFSSGQPGAVQSLPLSYARIFDHAQDLLEEGLPVIEHYQASRRVEK